MDKLLKIGIAAAAPLLLAAAAPTAQDTADLRCLVLAYQLAGNADENIKNGGILMSQYYLGRLDGRSPGLDLEALIEAESKIVDEAQIKTLLERCGGEVQRRGKQIEEMGARLEKKGI